MPALAYEEDTVLDCEDLDDEEIRACPDLVQLQGWMEGIEALSEDIHAQLAGYRSAGLNNLPWTYRAVAKLGYLGRGLSRIKRQMKTLGHDPNPYGTLIAKQNEKIQNLRADAGVAIEFKRLALEQMALTEYRELESAAVHALALRLAKEAAEAEAMRTPQVVKKAREDA